MKQFLIISFLLIVFFSVDAQMFYESKALDDFYTSQHTSGKKIGGGMNLENIAGSPYLNDNFAPGDVIMKNKVKYEGIPLRYNVYSKCIEFKNKQGGVLQIVETDMIEKVSLNGQSFVYCSYQDDNRQGNDYFECLNEGTNKLLKKYNVAFQEAQPAQPYSEPEPAKFIKKSEEYFILRNNSNVANKFKKIKDLEELLSDYSTELQSFIKKNKTKMKDEDLVELFNYCNSLN